VPGLTVEAAFVTDGRVHAVQHGRQEAPYFVEHVKRTEVYTNLANDKSVTAVVNAMTKDLRITDNGDGTITILVLATGNAVLYGEDGKALGRDPGQIRYEILIDTAGTPSDPSDDGFLAFLGVVKGSTGRSDDFCATAVPALS
jgi:nitrogen regulatory protein PII